STLGMLAPRWTKDSPPRLAFRPPAERTFESPLASLRLGSTYSAALSGARGKLEKPPPPGNPQFRKERRFSSLPPREHIPVAVIGEQGHRLRPFRPAQLVNLVARPERSAGRPHQEVPHDLWQRLSVPHHLVGDGPEIP